MLIRSETINELIAEHFADVPGCAVLATLARTPRLAPLGALLGAALTRDPKKRPTIARLRLGFSAIMPELSTLPWPIQVDD